MTLPGSHNLETAKEIHSFLEVSGLALFAALVIFEILAHRRSKRERLFQVLGLISFALAIFAEILAFPYSGQIDKLSSAEISRQKAIIAELEAKALPRHLNEEQKKLLTEGFKKAPRIGVILAYNPDDLECVSFMNDIGSCLTAAAAEWHKMAAVAGGYPRGISIGDASSPQDSPATLGFKMAFLATGISTANSQRPWHSEGLVMICVGSK